MSVAFREFGDGEVGAENGFSSMAGYGRHKPQAAVCKCEQAYNLSALISLCLLTT